MVFPEVLSQNIGIAIFAGRVILFRI